MFGTLRPNLCRLSSDQRQAYRRAYCGTCKALGDGYGQVARPLLSYDMVFLAAVIEGSLASASKASHCRCPLLPLVQREIIEPESPSVRVAAAMQVILASAWFDDQVSDGSFAYRPARALAEPRAEKAYAELASMGIEMDLVRTLSERQCALELQTRDIEALAGPTSQVLASALQQVSCMPLAIERSEEGLAAMPELGRALGVAIYAVDALEDLRADVQRSRFNPCVDATGAVSVAAIDRVCAALREALATIDCSLQGIRFTRGEAGIEAAAAGLYRRAQAAIAAAEKSREALATLRPQVLPLRWLGSVWRALWILPLWFVRTGRRSFRRARKMARSTQQHAACGPQLAFATGAGDGTGSGDPPKPNPIAPNPIVPNQGAPAPAPTGGPGPGQERPIPPNTAKRHPPESSSCLQGCLGACDTMCCWGSCCCCDCVS